MKYIFNFTFLLFIILCLTQKKNSKKKKKSQIKISIITIKKIYKFYINIFSYNKLFIQYQHQSKKKIKNQKKKKLKKNYLTKILIPKTPKLSTQGSISKLEPKAILRLSLL